jgi:hypothetical protein
MSQAGTPVVDRLRTALRAQYDEIVSEPLPERWVDLIRRLNEQEEREGGTRESGAVGLRSWRPRPS